MACKNVMTNFRLSPEEFEGIKILAAIKGVTVVDYVRSMFDEEIEKHRAVIDDYKKRVEELRNMME